MPPPISVRLDDEVRTELEAAARARGMGLSSLLRDLAAEAARAARRARIRAGSEAVAAHLASSAEGRDFYNFWGSQGALSDDGG